MPPVAFTEQHAMKMPLTATTAEHTDMTTADILYVMPRLFNAIMLSTEGRRHLH